MVEKHINYYSCLEKWVSNQRISLIERQTKTNLINKNYWLQILVASKYNEQFPTGQPVLSEANISGTHETTVQEHNFRMPSIITRFYAELIDIGILFILKMMLIRLIGGSNLFSQFIEYIPYDFLNGMPGYRIARVMYTWLVTFHSEMSEHDVFSQIFLTYAELLKPFQNDALLLSSVLWIFLRITYEIIFLSYSLIGSGYGGCSIGKLIFNLRVVSCSQMIALPNAIQVHPAHNPGLLKSFVRAVLKNSSFFFLSSLLQIYLTGDLVFSYDVLAGTVLVQLPLDSPHAI